MNERRILSRSRTWSRWMLLGAILVAGFLLVPPATAHDAHHDKHKVSKQHKRYGHGSPHHRSPGHGHAYDRYSHVPAHGQTHARYPYRHHARFIVPAHIDHGHVQRYRPYYHGAVYYKPHRHAHAVYHFPVATPAGYEYRPHYYCGGALYGGHVAYHGQRFSVSVGF